MLNRCEACERNQQPIYEQLRRFLPTNEQCHVLEVGSGSGQHALFFTEQQPNWNWQTSELQNNLASLNANLQQYSSRLAPPLCLSATADAWPTINADVIYTANTLHIMSAEAVAGLFDKVERVLSENGFLVVYGPFRYQQAFTAPSNEQFDQWLKGRDPQSGIRDFEWVNELAETAGLKLIEDVVMPANNQLLVWRKCG